MKPYLIIAVLFTLFISNSCKKEEDNEPAPVNSNPVTSPYYFTGKINGTTYTYNNGVNNYIVGGGLSSGSYNQSIEMDQFITVMQFPPQKYILIVSFHKIIPEAYTCDDIKSMFHTGAYTYGKRSDVNGGVPVEGVIVQYYDSNDVFWSSDIGTADQTGSTFSVTELIDNTGSTFSGYKIAKANFSCTVYDGNGNSKQITGATIRSLCAVCDR